MKRLRLSALLVIALGLAALSLARAKHPVIPTSEVILAEDQASRAATRVLAMDYWKAVLAYSVALPHLPGNSFHQRLYARALAHTGRWEEAARYLQLASVDSRIRGAAVADEERLRILDSGRIDADFTTGAWEELKVRFARASGATAVVSLENGILATANSREGTVTFWTASGNKRRTVNVMGAVAGLATYRGKVWVADLEGSRIVRIDPERGLEAAVDLAPLQVYGVRDVACDEQGMVWVADYGNGRVLRVTPEGALISDFSALRLDGPAALQADGRDVLVAEVGRNRIVRLSRDGRFLRDYSHRDLKAPVDIIATGANFLVQSQNGLVFCLDRRRDELIGPLQASSGPLMTSPLGLATDPWGNLWWGDGANLHMAHRIPSALPYHMVEILRSEFLRATSDAAAIIRVTAAVSGRSGRAIESMDQKSFRLLVGRDQVIPIAVENLSETLRGRRVLVVRELSDAVLPHEESVATAMEYFLRTLSVDDLTSVMEVSDTHAVYRTPVQSPELVRAALVEDRRRVASIDLRQHEALEAAIREVAQADHARAILWIASGEGVRGDDIDRLKRMGVSNQTPIFILHVGGAGEAELRELAGYTGGGYYRLYSAESPEDFFAEFARIRSGRYRVLAEMALPTPQDRGKWFDLSLEAMFISETAYDRSGYYSF